VRNLQVVFGPAYGDWALLSGPDAPAVPVRSWGVGGGGDGGGGEENLPGGGEGAEGAVVEDGGGERLEGEEGIMVGAVVARGSATEEERRSLREAIGKYVKMAEGEAVDGAGQMDVQIEGPTSSYFDRAVMVAILLNTLCMALENFQGYAVQVEVPHVATDHCCNSDCSVRSEVDCPRGFALQTHAWELFIFVSETIFAVFFTGEIVIKLVGTASLRRFVFDNWPYNLTDLLVVLMSDAIYIMELQAPSIFNLTIFRLVRVLRVVRMVSRLQRLRVLVSKAIASFKTILHVLCVLVFWHIIAALLGMQIFSCDVHSDELCQLAADGTCPEDCSLRIASGDKVVCRYTDEQVLEHCPWDEYTNFNEFAPAIVMLVFILTGEGWVEKMEMGLRATPTVWPGLLYFLIFYVVAFYMLYNLFIGVILEEFELTDDDKQGLQLDNFRHNIIKDFKRKSSAGLTRLRQTFRLESVRSEPSEGEGAPGPGALAAPGQEALAGGGGIPLGKISEEEPDVWILGCLPPPTPNAADPSARRNLRGYAAAIAQSTEFKRGMLVTILVSAVILALESPIPEYSSIDEKTGGRLDLVFFTIFSFEFVVKVLEHGIYWEHKDAYLTQQWNQLELVILLFQLCDIIGIEGLKSIRVMRVLRPLRLLNRSCPCSRVVCVPEPCAVCCLCCVCADTQEALCDGRIKSLQQLLMSIQASAADIINVLFLWLFMCLMFSICATNLFAGKLFSCNDGDFVGWPLNAGEEEGSPVGWRENCVGVYYPEENEGGSSYVADHMPTAILKPRVWSNPADGASGLGWHFDNFGMAFQTLFEVSTFEQWSDYVYSCVDMTQVQQGRKSTHALSHARDASCPCLCRARFQTRADACMSHDVLDRLVRACCPAHVRSLPSSPCSRRTQCPCYLARWPMRDLSPRTPRGTGGAAAGTLEQHVERRLLPPLGRHVVLLPAPARHRRSHRRHQPEERRRPLHRPPAQLDAHEAAHAAPQARAPDAPPALAAPPPPVALCKRRALPQRCDGRDCA
jgi:hypothetical protein